MTQATTATSHNHRSMFALVAIFLGSLLIAGALRFSGWHPAGMKNHGELLQPPGDLRAVVPQQFAGGEYHWDPAARLWRIVIVPPAHCAAACITLSKQLDTVWQLFGKDADRVHILWIGAPPADAVHNAATHVLQATPQLLAGLPHLSDAHDRATGIPVYVIDPNGFVILRYAPGFDPADLRSDMARLLKLM